MTAAEATVAVAMDLMSLAATTAAAKDKENKAKEAQKAKAAGGSKRGTTTIAHQA